MEGENRVKIVNPDGTQVLVTREEQSLQEATPTKEDSEPETGFQVFMIEQEKEGLDREEIRKMWLSKTNEEQRLWADKVKGEMSSSKKEPRKIFGGKKTKFSRFALSNIIQGDPELSGRVSKEAFNEIIKAVDLFTEELVKGSEQLKNKRHTKKRILKAEDLYQHAFLNHSQFWFCRDLRSEYNQAKEDKKGKKKETQVKVEKPVAPEQSQRITSFFSAGAR